MSHREDKSFTVQSRAGKVVVVNQGYLKKKSPKTFMGFAQWQDRFFVLEKDKFLYYKTDRARSMGEPASGVIPVSDIRSVSLPQDHKDGCRLSIETSSRRIYDLQAASASECQRWLNLLTTQCREIGTLADFSDEAAVDAAHERDLALMLVQNQQKGQQATDASGQPMVLGADPDFTEDELIAVDAEVIRQMEQFSLSVSLDLQGSNADKVAPFVVIFGPSGSVISSSQPQNPAAAAALAAVHAAADAQNVAAASSAISALEINGSAVLSSSTALIPARHPPSYYSNLEAILCDSNAEKNIQEVASSVKLLSVIMLYNEIRNFKLSNSCAAQTTTATNIWQRFLRKGAADFVAFPASTSPAIPSPSTASTVSTTSSNANSPFSFVITSPSSPSLAAPSLSLIDQVHDCLKKRQITLTTFDGILHHILHTLREEFWPVLVQKYPQYLAPLATNPPNLTFNPSQLHPSQRKISGNYNASTGVQIAYNRQGSVVNGNPLGKGWDELSRTEVLPRLGKKALVAGEKPSASATPTTNHGHHGSISGPSGMQMTRGHKQSIIGGEMPNSRLGERRHFDILLGVNMDKSLVPPSIDKRISRLNGLETLAQQIKRLTDPITNSAAAAAKARARRASALQKKPGDSLSPTHRRSSSFEHPVLPAAISPAAIAQAHEKALDDVDASLGRVVTQVHSDETDEDDDDDSEDEEEDEDAPPPPASSPPPDSTGGPSLTINTSQTITIDKNMKTLRFHLYHSTELGNEDLSSHILLSRMECTLKEIITSENGEMSRALFMVDGHGAGLSGFIHVMFHDRRTIKVANTPRYCYRSYIFRDIAGTDLLCHEALQESPFTFQLPHLALLRAADHARIMRKQIMQNLSETDASIVSGKNSVEEESQKSQMLSFMQRQVKAYTAVISQWEKLCKLYYNYSGVFHGLRFKPSVEKGSKALAFVPINCHIQSFSVTVTGRSRSRPAASLGTFIPSNLTRALTAHGPLNPSSTLSPQGLGGSSRNLMSTRPHAMTHAQHPNGTQSAELFLPPLEASSFLFEQADFLSELKAAHLRQAKKNAEIANTSVAGTSPGNNASVSPASSPSPPPPGAENTVAASVPVTSNLLTAPIPPTRPARGSFKKAAIRVMAARTMPKPASAQTKAVAQMIANSHAMAAASYSASTPGHLRDANSAPAFLTMSLGAGPSPLSGASSSSVHRQTVAESGKKEPKLNFTADENQALTAYTPAMSVGPNGENNLEKARLFRKVPPRSPYDRTYSCHNYMNTTCGAFVAHSLGFKQAGGGGMMKLLGRMYEQLGKHAGDVASIRTRMEAEEGVATLSSPNPASQSTSANNSGSAGSKDAHNVRLVHALLESGQKVLSQQWENQQRQHTIVSQAMTALTTSFVAQLLTNLHQIDVWRRIVKIGYLQQVESLLSTFHSEQYMLQDFCYAVRALEHVKVTIVQQTEAREVEEDAFGHYLDPVKLNETLKAAAAAATSAAAVGGSGAASLTVPPPPPNVPPNVPAPDRSRSPSPPPPPPPSGGEAVAASVSVSAASSVEPASPAPGAGFAPPNNTPANSAGIPPQIRTSSAPAAIVSPEGEADALPLMNRVHSLEEEDVPPPPMEPHPAASASVAPAPTAVSVTAASSTTPASNNSLAPPLPPRKRTVSQGQRPANLAPPLVSPASPSQPPASPSASSGVSSPGATLSPPPAISPAAIRSVSPTTRKVNTMTMPSPNFISNRIARPQAKTMHQPIQRSPAAVAAAALGSEEDFVSAEDNIPQVAAGMAPTVHQRVQEINTVHISLLVPPTAAPIASLPFATEAPGSTMPGASKKTKWFSMSSSGSNGTENSAAAQAAAEAAAKAAGAMPFTTTPSLPHPYSASSVVIVIELPPHLYRLLPVCLRELEPKSAPAAASSQTSNNSLNVPPSTLSGANSPVTPSLNGNDSHKVMEEIAPIGSVPGVTSGTFSTPVGSSLLNSSSSFDDSTAPLNKASVTTTPVPPTAAPVLTSSDQEAPQLSTPLIDIWPVLITQGVNELQTMANKMGRNELQQEINLYSLEILKAYFIMFAKYQKAHLDVISASSKERLKNGSMLQMIGKDLQACELMIQSFNAEKNIQLLVLCADIVKRMSGGRIVCCKSAKDRTSMAVTWDQARLLYEQHGLSEHDVQSALNLMRTEGVRKLNVVKNTGQSAYAFNMLQRSLLPAIFRPPEHSCSSSIEG